MAPSPLSYDPASRLHGQRGQVETVHGYAEVIFPESACEGFSAKKQPF